MLDERQEKWLRWTCMGCKRTWDIQMPGFPGTTVGKWHWHTAPDAARNKDEGRCDGPIVAVIIP